VERPSTQHNVTVKLLVLLVQSGSIKGWPDQARRIVLEVIDILVKMTICMYVQYFHQAQQADTTTCRQLTHYLLQILESRNTYLSSS
jgi:hypothetical protein